MLTYYPLPRAAGTRREYDTVVATVCQECPLHCGLQGYLKHGVIVEVQGAEEHPVNQGRLCARGIAFREALQHPGRLLTYRYRAAAGQDWQTLPDHQPLFDLLAQRLQRLREQQGPAALGIFCAAASGLDFYLGALVFASLWGTPKVYQERASWLASGFARWVNPTASCSEWPQLRALILVEADPARQEPLLCRWLQEARRRGAKVLVADSRFTATAAQADEFLRLRPGSGNWLGLALGQQLQGRAQLQAVPGALAIPDLAREQLTPEVLAAVTGVSPAAVARLADWLAACDSGVWISGPTLARQPGALIWLTLAQALGWLAGGGWYPLGAGLPPFLQFEEPAPWPTATELQELAALIVSGEVWGCWFPEPNRQESAPWLVHYGTFPGPTAAAAQVTVPAALWPEKEAPTCSNDRLWYWGSRLVAPPPTCLTGLEFWRELAARFGWQEHFPADSADPSELLAFYRRILQDNPLTAGLDLEALRQGQPQRWSLDWLARELPATLSSEPGTVWPAPPAVAEPEAALFPLWWQTLEANSGPELVGLSRSWQVLEPTAVWIQVHPDTAAALGIHHGDAVEVHWETGSYCGRAGLSRMVPVWLVAAPLNLGARRILLTKAGHSLETARQILQEFLR